MRRIILFDGVCTLCNGFVQLVIRKDPEAKFQFASLQSPAGQSLLKEFDLPVKEFGSLVYIEADRHYLKSTAALKIFQQLSGVYPLSGVLLFVPAFIRNFVYDLLAASRYNLMGRSDSCMLPTPSLKNRFLDSDLDREFSSTRQDDDQGSTD